MIYQDRRALRVMRNGLMYVAALTSTAPLVRLADPEVVAVASLAATLAFLVSIVVLAVSIRL